MLGRLAVLEGGSLVHARCAHWAAGVVDDPSSSLLVGVYGAMRRSARLRCTGCGRRGPTIGCRQAKCRQCFHLPCAVLAGCLFDVAAHSLYCATHAPALARQALVGRWCRR